ncbi:hypothetical protein N657DRAFT_633501 [Parathielavia appendiculata]|uniref:Uncharacterized protein n=1 Tax=Parathielavia appendiculata TaxID=2587402 RepID=A0AAN6U134_9PEZI|nr:hypothetical protein N657DRAFT_633501 [Parathielavia appendiculata]
MYADKKSDLFLFVRTLVERPDLRPRVREVVFNEPHADPSVGTRPVDYSGKSLLRVRTTSYGEIGSLLWYALVSAGNVMCIACPALVLRSILVELREEEDKDEDETKRKL